MGNFEAAVDMCLSEDKMAEAILLAIAGGPELLSLMNSIYYILQMLMVYYGKLYWWVILRQQLICALVKTRWLKLYSWL